MKIFSFLVKFVFFTFLVNTYCGSMQPRYIPDDYKKISNKSNIYKTYDKFKDTIFYRPEYSFESSVYGIPSDFNRESFYLYAGKSKDDKWLRANFLYAGSDWIFFTNAYLLGENGERMDFDFKSYQKVTDVITGGVFEEIDLPIDKSQLIQLVKILKSKKVYVKLTGKYSEEYELSDIAIYSLRELLNYYGKL